MPDTVSDRVVAILTDWGVDTVFGLPGDGINGLVEAFRKAKDRIRYRPLSARGSGGARSLFLRKIYRPSRCMLRHSGAWGRAFAEWPIRREN